jgi:hypothetical protein
MMLPPGDELLMCAARSTIDATTSERIRELCRSDIDWDRLVDAAHRHGIASLLYRTVAALAPDALPHGTLERLATGFSTTVAFNLQQTGALVELLDLLTARDIRALPFKGPVLATLAYGSVALRQFADLDLLVPAANLWEVDQIVRGLGYQRHGAEELARGGKLPSEGQFLYRQEQGRVMIELHWELAQRFYSFPFDFDELWQRRMSVQLGGRAVATFGFEDTIVTLALHHTKHRWERLIWICDFAELLRSHPEREWEGSLRHAADVGAERAVLLGIHLAGVLSGASVPSWIARRIDSDPDVERLAGQVIMGLVSGGGEYSGISERIAFNLQARERLSDRLRFGLRRLLVPTLSDRSTVRLPTFVYGLYYLVRPIRLLLDRVKSIARGRS